MQEGMTVGKYQVIRPLGTGGEGTVYLAEDRSLFRPVAVKQIGKDSQGTEEKMLREAAFLRDLHHHMLPAVYDLFWEEGWYLVMEYIEGVSLHNYIKERGGVGEEKGCLWAEALLDILEYLHTRKPPVIYRDLKPDNLMVCLDGSLRLVDLGAACRKHYGEGGETEMALTPGYAAPEQMAGAGRRVYADERSDIYAFGRVFYYMLTGADPGKPPYAALPVRAYDPLAGEYVEQVIAKCTEEDPGRRYQTAEEIDRDLRRRGEYKKGEHKRGGRRQGFVRHVEKRVWLTEKQGNGLDC